MAIDSLKRSTAGQSITFALVNATSGSADTGASVTVYITQDNAAQITGLGSVINKGNGQYVYKPLVSETNGTDVGFLFIAAGDLPVNIDFHTDTNTALTSLKILTLPINCVVNGQQREPISKLMGLNGAISGPLRGIFGE